MAFEVDMKVDAMSNQKLQLKLFELAGEFGVTFDWLAADQLRLLVADLMRFGPPKAQPKGALTDNSKIDKKIGFKRVEKDIHKVIVPIKTEEWSSMRELGWNLSGKYRFKTRKGAVYLVDADMVMPNASRETMRKHHERYRRKDGRTTEARGGSESGSNELRIGRWKHVTKLHVHENLVNKYVRERQKAVLRLASSWLPSFNYLSARVNANKNKSGSSFTAAGIPLGAMRKAVGGQEGRAEDFFYGVNGGTLKAVSTNPYASAKYRRMLPALLNKRNVDINGKLRLRMERNVARFNAGRF